MSLGIDTTQSDQMVRGSVPLPHGIGKAVRVLVFCQGDNVAKAKEAGADFAGSDDLIEKIQKEGWLDFDVALATQDMMGKCRRLGKVLGPRGLMPTPKAGTVVPARRRGRGRPRVQGRQGRVSLRQGRQRPRRRRQDELRRRQVGREHHTPSSSRSGPPSPPASRATT